MTFTTPLTATLVSSLGAAAFVGLVFARGDRTTGERALGRRTPRSAEQTAEAFIERYVAGDLEQAARDTVEPLRSRVRARARRVRLRQLARGPATSRLVIEETESLGTHKLRVFGMLERDGAAPHTGRPVALVVTFRDERYFVEDLAWPSGPPVEPR